MSIRPTKYLKMPDGNEYEFFGKSYYGECTTISSGPTKDVNIDGFVLEEGVRVSILFRNANTYQSPQLCINNGVVKDIAFFNETIINATQIPKYLWSDNQVVEFIYTGNKWLMLNNGTRIWYGTSSTPQDTAIKYCSMPGFNPGCLKEGTIIVINFTNPNLVESGPSIKINNTTEILVSSPLGFYKWQSGVHTFILINDLNNQPKWHMVDATTVFSVNGQTGYVNLVIPSGNSAIPLMDGTGSAGTSIYYSKSDHVHPTDTSRQEVLVSGTNIKTIGGNSILGSGNISLPTVVSDLTNDAGYISTETDPTVPSWAKETNPPSYTLTYDQNSSVGSAQAGTAVTGTANYTPSGEISVTKRHYNVVSDLSGLRNVANRYTSNNGMWLRFDVVWNANTVGLDVIDDVTFNGAGVNFVIERDDS